MMHNLLKKFCTYFPSSINGPIKYIMNEAHLFRNYSLIKSCYKRLDDMGFSNYDIPVLIRLLKIANISSLSDKRICEIGGAHNFSIAKLFYNISNNIVIECSPDPYTSLTDEYLAKNGIKLFRIPFEDLNECEYGFDIIYGCAVLEHILNIDNFFKKAYDSLNNGGYIIIHGSPMWHSRYGHHTYCNIDDFHYHMGTKNCPVDDFSHLYFDWKGMHEDLIKNGIEKNHAEIICNDIYIYNHINRYSIERIINGLVRQPWDEIKCVMDSDTLSEQDLSVLKLHNIHPESVRHPTVYLCAKKHA